MPIFIKKYISLDVDPHSITRLYKYTPQGPISNLEMYSLITISKAPEGYADRASKFVWDAITENFDIRNSSIDSVKGSINAASKKLLELLKNDSTVSEAGIDMNIAIVLIKEATAYIGVFGEQIVTVNRGGEYINISDVLSRNKVLAASFAIEPTDVVIVSSPSGLTTELGSEDLSNVVLDSSDRLKAGEGFFLVSRSEISGDFVDIPDVTDSLDLVSEEINDEELIEDVQVISPEEVVEEETKPIEVNEDGLAGDNEMNIGGHEVVSQLVESEDDKVSSKKQTLSEKMAELKSRAVVVKEKLLVAWNGFLKFVSPIERRLGNFWNRFSEWFWRFIDNRYGRQVWYKRMKAKLSVRMLGKGGSAYGMKIDGYKETSLRGRRFGALLLIVLLVIVITGGVKFSMNAKELRETHRIATEVFAKVDGFLKSAEGSLPGDTLSAENYIFQAEQELEKLKSRSLSYDDQQRRKKIDERMGKIDDRLAKRVWISEDNGGITTFLSTRLKFGTNSDPTDITIYKGDYQDESLFVVDRGEKGVYRVNIFNQKAVKIPDKQGLIKDPLFVDIGNNGVYVFDRISGVVRSRFGNDSTNLDFEPLTGLGADDLGITDIRAFAVFEASDHINLLSPSNKAIYRSNFTGSGYSLPFTFISDESFSTGVDFFGDIAIYVLTQRGDGVERFSYVGAPSKFDPAPVGVVGVRETMKKIVAGYTGATLDNNMYVFEGGENIRLVVLEKPKETIGDMRHPNEMWLVQEYKYNGTSKDILKNVKDLVVDYQEQNIYILDGTEIYKVKVAR